MKVNVSVELDKLRILFKNRTDKSEKVEIPEGDVKYLTNIFSSDSKLYPLP